ncbi:MAG: protein-tyrosine phosphatase [Myxococcota bacterium]|jgi:protein-tyrosine phosphatase
MKILFICTGNICRSPTAHAIAQHRINSLGLKHVEVDSAGTTSFHSGQKPDSRSVFTGKKRGINFDGILSKQVSLDDFENFDLIFAMDRNHVSSLRKICPAKFENKIQLFLQYADVENSFDDEVIDPYYGENGFEEVFDLIDEALIKILSDI